MIRNLKNYIYKNLKFVLSGIVVIGCVIMIFQYIHVSSPASVFAETASGLPLRILIPRMHVDSTVEEVVKNSKGSIESPKLALNTGWYSLSPKPGEEGSSIIYGYVHWKFGYTARFADLHLLKPGDTISVIDDRGIITSFIIREMKNFDLNTDISKVFRSSDGKSHLNLITYDGSWDEFSKSYSKRLVVFTDKDITTTPTTISDESTKDYTDDKTIFDKTYEKALTMPDGLSQGMVKQFLEKSQEQL